MSYVDGLKAVATQQCDMAEDSVDFLETNRRILVTAGVDTQIAMFPPLMLLRSQMIDSGVATINFLLPYLRDAIKSNRKAIEYLGDPDALHRAARLLSGAGEGSARDVLASMKDELNPVYFRTKSSWQGETADTYREIAELQPANAEALIEPIDTLATVLDKVAQGIENFYVALAGAAIATAQIIGDLVVAIIGACTAGTGVGAVVAVIGVVKAIGDVMISLLAVATTFLNTQHENEDLLATIGPSLSETGKWMSPPIGDGPPGS